MLQEVVNEYISSLSSNGQERGGTNSNTIVTYRNDLSQVSNYLKRRNIENWQQVTREDIANYLLEMREAQAYRPTTIARQLAALKTFFRYMRDTGIISSDPVEEIGAPRVQEDLPHTLSQEQIDQRAQDNQPEQDTSGAPDVPDADLRTPLIKNETLRAVFETSLIVAGLIAMLVLLPHGIFGDGAVRFQAISDLLEHGKLSNMHYSIVGPAFSIPFWLLGKLYMTPEWWLARYNLFVFAAGLLVIYLLLKNRMDHGLIRKFFLILIIASMFANHLMAYYGEVFTAMCVAIGILILICGRSLIGWSTVVLGVINTPASVVGLGCVVLKQILQNKRLSYILVFIAAIALIVIEYTIRRGSFSINGYEAPPNPALHTVMPYSGKRGFSYPFFFGLLSILFSFGKGLFFFAPGLLLPVRALICKIRDGIKLDLYAAYLLWISFLIGLILVYSPWWAWYGGWFWGPRFFLFASIPASFAIALRLHYRGASLAGNLLTAAVFLLSLWVGINGALFDQQGLGICIARSYALELLCHYTPEFSVLWHPFVANEFVKLDHHQLAYLAYSLFVFAYLAIPFLADLLHQAIAGAREFGRMYLNVRIWRF